MAKPKILLIDVDGVLHERNYGIAMVQKLKNDISTYPQIMRTLGLYKQGKIKYNEMTKQLISLYARGTAKVPYYKIQKAAEEVVAETPLRPGINQLITAAKKKGYLPMFITASPVEAAKILATKYGVKIAVGTQLNVRKGVCTGRLKSITFDSVGKASMARYLQVMHDVNLKNSAALGDSAGDLEMFKKVGKPIIFGTTDKKLMGIAARKKWSVAQDLKAVGRHL